MARPPAIETELGLWAITNVNMKTIAITIEDDVLRRIDHLMTRSRPSSALPSIVRPLVCEARFSLVSMMVSLQKARFAATLSL